MTKRYAGVGSRGAPPYALRAMKEIGALLALDGYELSSGHADGSDLAFENGCDLAEGEKKIFLPEKGFNGSTSTHCNVSDAAKEMALAVHPAPHRLLKKPFALRLHARNCYQVLNETLDDPVDFVVCWTEDAIAKGGTRTAIMLAKKHKVPVLNLGKCKTYIECMNAFHAFYLVYG